jgi:glutamate-ammonia-ligase adenylyltransferase
MTPTSDLDLIFVYDYAEAAQRSDGPTPLEPTRYFARLSQRTINAITAQTADGVLYEVDMRLRPSGNAGPIASHIAGFEKYHEEQAWTWEHMALTRARVIVVGDRALGARVDAAIRKALTQPRDPDKLRADVADMRQRIEREFKAKSRWEVKYLRGGLVDIDFIAQYLQLRHGHDRPEVLRQGTVEALNALARAQVLAAPEADQLLAGFKLWQAVQGLLRLAIAGRFEPEDDAAVPEALRGALLRATGEPDFRRLTLRMDETARAVHMIYQRIIETGDD